MSMICRHLVNSNSSYRIFQQARSSANWQMRAWLRKYKHWAFLYWRQEQKHAIRDTMRRIKSTIEEKAKSRSDKLPTRNNLAALYHTRWLRRTKPRKLNNNGYFIPCRASAAAPPYIYCSWLIQHQRYAQQPFMGSKYLTCNSLSLLLLHAYDICCIYWSETREIVQEKCNRWTHK